MMTLEPWLGRSDPHHCKINLGSHTHTAYLPHASGAKYEPHIPATVPYSSENATNMKNGAAKPPPGDMKR